MPCSFGLALCYGGPRYESSIDAYFPKKPKRPEFCCECEHWKGNCQIGYTTTYSSKACKQAIEKTAPRSY